MKTLIQKELRENFKWALLGLLVWTVLLIIASRSYSNVLRDLDPSRVEGLQPLNSLPEQGGWLCAILGLLLGWFQIHNETHNDLWAFLVHRPVTRTSLFFGKIIAGITLYLLAAGIPLFCFIAWVAIPGHVAAPFEWSMVFPVAGHFLAGVVYYFAGMLTGLRKARWYGSRGLGIGLALISSGAAVALDRPWDFLTIFLCAAVLALAGWGAFHSDGHYEAQPFPGKVTLTAALTIGAAVVLFVGATGLLAPLISDRSFSWSTYVMAKDGIVYKEVQRPHWPPQVFDLTDNPIKDPKTGRALSAEEFNRRRAKTAWVNVQSEQRLHKAADPQRWLTYWGEDSGILWYYWNRYGRLVGYNRITRRFIGSIGPSGFASNFSGAGDRFLPPIEHNAWVRSRTLATATTLYQLDLDNRATKVLFQIPSDDPIEASKDEILAADDSKTGYDWTALVITRRFVHLLSADGTVIFKQPYAPFPSRPTDIRVYFLEPPSKFALWIAPGFTVRANLQDPPIQVTWIGPDQGVIKRAELPMLAWSNPTPPLWEDVMSSLAPPGIVVALRIFTAPDSAAQIEWKTILISVATAVFICMPIGLWLGRRYNFTNPTLFGWLAFLLLSGLPGLLAFLSVHEWPARVSCPKCGKLRAVDLDPCQHCGAQFPPPDKTGIEIFEPLTNP